VSVPILEPQWAAPRGVRAAFSLRSGGTSTPPWDSLNLGVHVGDDPAAVAENRRRLRHTLGLPSEPIWLDQVHGTAVVHIDSATGRQNGRESPPAVRPRADAAVTRERGVVLAVQVADCLPVLLASPESVLGAAHAGWRGLAAGVIEGTVAAMQVPPSQLVAWLGPCIGPAHFEVGDEVRAAFLAADPAAAAAFEANAQGRWQCDLPQLARARLRALGIRQIAGGEWCTAADPVRFYSHRRDQRTGRMAALIWC
jgi:YfiH family protein